jgi:large subunit ribosomal protein L15
MLALNNLQNIPGSRKTSKRLGRGIGSGKGKTCGRGHKGQKSRAGVSIKTEGGQMPIIKRLPKRGFKSLNKNVYDIVDINYICHLINGEIILAKNVIDKQVLKNLGIIKNVNCKVKVVGKAIEPAMFKMTLKFDAYSSSVKEAVNAHGGQAL